MKTKYGVMVLALSATTMYVLGCGGDKNKPAEQAEKAQESGSVVTIVYNLHPDPANPLPQGLSRIAVEQVKTSYEAKGGADDSQVDKWRGIASDMLMSTLQKQARTSDSKLIFVDTASTGRVKEESDLAAMGATSGDASTGKMKDVQARLAGKVEIIVTRTQTKGRTLNSIGAFGYGGWGGGGGGGAATSEEATGIRRDITINSMFTLTDLKTREAILSYGNNVTSGAVKKSGFITGSKGEGDLKSGDAEIRDLINAAITEFVCQLVGGKFSFDVPVMASKSEASKAGVRKLLAEDYSGALADFRAALASDANDDLSAYGAGVACEASGTYKQARSYYLQAQSINPSPIYKEAADRVKRLMPFVKSAD